MSVAFRRESDEEHREPKFELPIPAGPNLVTPRGARLIAERVAALEAELAATEGEAREAAARQLRYWNTRAVTAAVAPAPPADEVAFGSRVLVRVKGRDRWWEIVGDDEADPAGGRLAWSAPLARALLGAVEGERVPFGDGEAEVLEIAAPGDEV